MHRLLLQIITITVIILKVVAERDENFFCLAARLQHVLRLVVQQHHSVGVPRVAEGEMGLEVLCRQHSQVDFVALHRWLGFVRRSSWSICCRRRQQLCETVASCSALLQ